ncbi:MAG: class I SAM-dependent methyltransferase [Gemmatimonadetes bacterium]|nr:class I SAM-dependent methyltransferase [Gemmatimonadota bacterium]MDA1104630.1 class I SAM-dependent methyltransferase [Gemmatimonadota bacterium]
MSEPRKIDKEFYDSSDYFENRGNAHLHDHNSPFQQYRITKVLQIHTPARTDRVVDLGCGWGTFGFALADRVAELLGVDFSERSIEICEQRLQGSPRKALRFLCADAGATGLAADAYDVVLAADLFEHLYPDDSERVTREAFRILAPGGRFVTWTPHRGHILEVLKNRDIILRRDISHVDYKSMSVMEGLLSRAGFEIEKAYYAESHVPGLRVAERLLQGVVPLLRRRIAVLGRKPGG